MFHLFHKHVGHRSIEDKASAYGTKGRGFKTAPSPLLFLGTYLEQNRVKKVAVDAEHARHA